jgi:cytochrome b561
LRWIKVCVLWRREKDAMAFRDSRNGFGLPSRALHWASALVVLLAWVLGTTMESLPKGAPRQTGFEIHVGFGAIVLTLVALRLLWRLANPMPALPPGTPLWQRLAAQAVHVGLYAAMLALPATGLAAAWASGKEVRLFWTWVVPSLLERDRALGHTLEELHETLGNVLLVLVGLHVVAALWHHFIRRDGVLRQMLRGAA